MYNLSTDKLLLEHRHASAFIPPLAPVAEVNSYRMALEKGWSKVQQFPLFKRESMLDSWIASTKLKFEFVN